MRLKLGLLCCLFLTTSGRADDGTERDLITPPPPPPMFLQSQNIDRYKSICSDAAPCSLTMSVDIDEAGNVHCATVVESSPENVKFLLQRLALRTIGRAKYKASGQFTRGQRYTYEFGSHASLMGKPYPISSPNRFVRLDCSR